MTVTKPASNKAKIARRVIEVLEYFDDTHREATVMDIVRRYNRPQSSTSELLSSLVELGLLHKDAFSRSYSLTPRAALLGVASQSQTVRDGGLIRLMDRLVAQTGLAVAIYGMVGLNTQIISWRAATRGHSMATRGLFGGMQEPIHRSAPGQLLLSTLPSSRSDGILRRLNAEAPDDGKFATSAMALRLRDCRENGYALGSAGFDSSAETLSILLPDMGDSAPLADGAPLAVGFAFGPEARIHIDALLQSLRDAVNHCLTPDTADQASVESLSTAA
jgi:DNA-binding IclR family transcriptional regulator